MTYISSSRNWLIVLALLCCTLALPAHADPAGRIGRIAWLSGTAQLTSANSRDALVATLNQPLTTGDNLAIGANSRAEIEIGSLTVRLDAGSRIQFDRIDDEGVQLFLDEGRAIVRLTSGESLGEFSIETRDGRFSARRTGVYRFDADSRSTVAAVYAGTLHFSASDSASDIAAKQGAQFWYDGSTRSRPLALVNDDFSQWSMARDERGSANTYSRYVSPEMTGAADLDAYGVWSDAPDVGAIWYPRAVADDWTPYRYGQWVWVAPWGWNWVAQEPWGFAPFHYGRWLHSNGRWGWVPGTRVARPVYAPAMVSWIGAPGVRVAIGGRPTVGWFPLAPHEIYVPAYRTSERYVRNVNAAHVPHINNVTVIVNNPQAFVQRTHYANRESPQAVTIVPAEVVTGRRQVAPAALATTGRVLREQSVRAAAPVAAPAAPPVTGAPGDLRNRQGRQDRRQFPAPATQPVQTPPSAAGGPAPQRFEREPAPVVGASPRQERSREFAAPARAQTPAVTPSAPVGQVQQRFEHEPAPVVGVPPRQERSREFVAPTPASVAPPSAAVVAPQPRAQERFEPRVQERAVQVPRQEQPAIRTPQAGVRSELAPVRQAPVFARPEPQAAPAAPVIRDSRRDAPREIARPAEPARGEQGQHAERRRSEEKGQNSRGEAEKR